MTTDIFVKCLSTQTDEPEYIDCPECRGEGRLIEGRLYPNGHTEVWVKCEFCEGEGNFEEADFILMKLAGEV